MSNKITVLLELLTDKAQAAAKGFKASVADAEGGVNKFKAGASSAFTSVGLSAGTLAIGAGGAIAGFGVKSVKAFEDAGLAAGKFSDAAGISTQQASRLQEVAGDLGVSADSIAGSFVKMEKAIGSNSPAVKELGLEVVRTKDGQVDANATFLEAIRLLGGVTDANKKAEIAAKLFGKGFADSAEILVGNAADIQKRLDAVSKQRVLSPQQVKDARDMRDAFKNIGDEVEGLEIAIGSKLAPELATLAGAFAVLIAKAEELDNKLNDLGNQTFGGGNLFDEIKNSVVGTIDPFTGLSNAINVSTEAWDKLTASVPKAGEQIDRAQDSIIHIETGAERAAAAVAALGDKTAKAGEQIDRAKDSIGQTVSPLDDLRRAAADAIVPIGDVGRTFHDMVDEIRQSNADLNTEIGKLRGTIDLGSQLDDISSGFDDITAAAKDMADKVDGSGRKFRDAVRKQQLQLLDLLDQYKQIPAQKRTEIVAEIASGDVDKLNKALDDIIGKDRFVHVGLIMPNIQQAFSGVNVTVAPGGGGNSPTFLNQNLQPAPVNNSQTTIIYPVGSSPTTTFIDQRLYATRNGTNPR